MYHLTKYEKENILLSTADEDFWSVYINSKPLKRRFAEFDRKNHGVLRHIRTDQYGGELYEVPKSSIAIKLIPPRTKEQTEKAKAHAEKVGLGKKDG